MVGVCLNPVGAALIGWATKKSFENLLRPIFKDDEWIVIVVGAVLGFAVGLLQEQLILALVAR